MENRHALLIGINTYENFPPINQLGGCVNDVNLFRSVLIEKFDFSPNRVTVVSDDAAEADLKPTKSNIEKQFLRLINETKQNDVILIYYSGHGSRIKNSSKPNGWSETIVPCDSGRNSYPNRDITDDMLNEVLQQLCAKTSNVILLIDSCRSGHVFREIEDEGGPKERRVEEDERDLAAMEASTSSKSPRLDIGPSGWLPLSNRYTLLAACLSTECAHEYRTVGTAKVYGAWTYAICQALSMASSTTFSYRDLFEIAYVSVIKRFAAQHPVIEGNLHKQVFGFAVRPTEVYALAFLVPSTLEEVNIEMGTVHGVTLGSRFQLINKEKIDQPLATAEVIKVDVDKCYAKIVTNVSWDLHSINETSLRAFEIAHKYEELALPIRFISTASDNVDPAVNQRIVNAIDKIAKDIKLQSRFLNIVDITKSDSAFSMKLQLCNPPTNGFQVNVYSPDGIKEFSESIDSKLDTKRLISRLNKMGRYYRGIGIENQNLSIGLIELKSLITFDLLEYDTESKNWKIKLADATKGEKLPVFRVGANLGVRIVNLSSRPFYIALLEFAEAGEIDQLHPSGGGEEILVPKQDGKEGGEMILGSRWNPLQITNRARPFETFKLFVSEKKIDYSPLLQEAYMDTDVEKSRGEHESKVNDNDLDDPLIQLINASGDSRFVGSKPANPLWFTLDRSFEIKEK